MLLLDIQSLTSGKHPVKVEGKVDVSHGNDYFFDNVVVEGTLRVHGNSFILDGSASSQAKLVCDLSLEEYEELITADVSITIIKGVKEELRTDVDENTIYVNEEAKNADITDIVLQELLVKIPMKKVAPKYRGKEIDEIYPLIKEEKEDGRSPFDVLKNLKNN
jgi:uncharacterized metal-binding protein YceD (DUF177 family)